MKKTLAFLFTCLLMSNATLAQTRLFKPGSAQGADAVITRSNCISQLNTNYGQAAENNVFNLNDQPDGCGPRQSRTLIRFDALSTLPKKAVIVYAELRLYKVPEKNTGGHTTEPGKQTGWVRRVTSGWAENSVNWNNQPGFTTSGEAAIPAINKVLSERVSVNVTAQVMAIITSGQNNGFILMPVNEQQNGNISFASSDHNDSRLWPELYIVYRGACDANFTWCGATSHPGEYTFTVENNIPGYTYTWLFGDGTSATGYSVSHAYSASDSYTITLTALSEETKDSCTEHITLCAVQGPGNRSGNIGKVAGKKSGAERDACNANFTWCGSTSHPGAYNYNIETSTPGFEYSWSFGDGAAAAGTSVSHTYITSGVFETGLDAFETETAERCKAYVSLCVNEIPDCIASFTTEPTANEYEFLFRSQTSAGLTVISYDWDYGDGSIFNGGPDAIYAYTTPGVYNVCLSVTYETECMVRYCSEVTVNGVGLRNSARAFQPGRKEINSAANNVLAASRIGVSPSPVTGGGINLNINTTTGGTYRYTIFSAQGMPLITGTKNLQKGIQNTELDITRLRPGKYWVALTNNQLVLRTSFIKL